MIYIVNIRKWRIHKKILFKTSITNHNSYILKMKINKSEFTQTLTLLTEIVREKNNSQQNPKKITISEPTHSHIRIKRKYCTMAKQKHGARAPTSSPFCTTSPRMLDFRISDCWIKYSSRFAVGGRTRGVAEGVESGPRVEQPRFW